MLNISKENNSIRVEATDYSFYPFNGVVTYPLNSVIVVTDKSDMATFKSSTNGDVLFVGNINELTIDGNAVTKETIVDTFTKIANASASIDTSTFAKKTDLDTLSAEVEHKADKTSVYTIEETNGKLDKKQDKLVAGDNITLTDNPTDGTTTISATGGVNGLVIDENKVAAGLNQTINEGITDAVAIGNGVKIEDIKSIAIGHAAEASHEGSIAIGYNSSSFNSVCIGINTSSYSQGATIIGNYIKNQGTDTTAIGCFASCYSEKSTAIGYNATTTLDIPLCINAGYDNNRNVLTMIQGGRTGKISILAGDGTKDRMVIQDEVNSLKTKKQDKLVAGSNITLTENTADGTVTIASTGGGSVDAYTKAESDAKYALKTDHETLAGEVATLEADKQDKLTAGTGITIDGNTISATGGGSENQYIKVNEKNIAIGNNANSYEANDTICIGTNAQSNGNSSIVIGGVQSTAKEAVTIGYGGNNGGNNSVAIGSVATVGDDVAQGVAIGPNANATAEYPLSIKAGGTSVFASKEMLKGDPNGKLYVIDGSATMCLQDEINALKNAGGGSGSVSGLTIDNNQVTAGLNQTTTGATNIVAIGNSITASGSNPIVLGDSASAENYSIAMGRSAQANGSSSIVLGDNASTTGDNTIVLGDNASTAGHNSIVIGNNASTTSEESVALGYKASAGYCSIAMGQNSSATMWSLVLGDKANSTGESSVVLGANAKSIVKNGTALGYKATASTDSPLCITAGKDDNGPSITMIQGSSVGKISIPAADGTTNMMCLQDEINALKAQLVTLTNKLNTINGEDI